MSEFQRWPNLAGHPKCLGRPATVGTKLRNTRERVEYRSKIALLELSGLTVNEKTKTLIAQSNREGIGSEVRFIGHQLFPVPTTLDRRFNVEIPILAKLLGRVV